MLIGLLSDIHSNALALRSVLESAKKLNVEKLLCCGDYIGYYYEPLEVFEILNQWDWDGIAGNHEKMLQDWIENKNRNKIIKKYGHGISIANEELDKKIIEHLINMPNLKEIEIDNCKFLLCHGSPWDLNIYIYPDSNKKLIDRLFKYNDDFDILVFGHTHYQTKWNKDKKIVINPGSVGQSREKGGLANWSVIDTKTLDLNFYQTYYNTKPLIEQCRNYDPEIKYLEDVLLRK